MDYIITIDQGTTATKVALFSLNGELKGLSTVKIKQFFPYKGWVEQEPYDILNSINKGIKEVISKANIDRKNIVSIAIANQGETVIPFDRYSGEPLYRAIVWQDKRTTSFCNELKKRIDEKVIVGKTGLLIDPYFSASKIRWVIENVDSVKRAVKKGRAVLASSDVWLLYVLTGYKSIYTDVSTASRTMLFNINILKWDEEIVDLFKIPKDSLPEVTPSIYNFGLSKSSYCGEVSVPINAMVVDQAASLFGHTCFYKGEAKITYGTGGFLLISIGKERIALKDKIITVITAQYDNNIYYALDGGVYSVGSCIDWLVENLNFVSKPELTSDIALSLQDNGDVYYVPALDGLSVPYWQPDAKGAFLGLSRDNSKKHQIRAVLEGIAFRFLEIINVIKNNGLTINSISVDGGVSRNDFLMQFQSNLLGININRPLIKEVTSLGAYFLAGLKIGLWSDLIELKDKIKLERVFYPEKDNTGKMKQFKIWKNALLQIINWHNNIKGIQGVSEK